MSAKKTSDLKKHFDIKIAAKDFAAKIEEKLNYRGFAPVMRQRN